MRRSAVCLLLSIIILAGLNIGCGGGSSKPPAPSSIVFNVSQVSLDVGRVAGVSATVVDTNGAAVSNTKITFSSSNSSIVTVSPGGLVCAGTWDANFIVCTPGPTGQAQITATSANLTASIPVFTHVHIDRITISPGTVNCRSQGQTQQMSAQAFSGGVDVSNSVGPFTWVSTSPTVAGVDSNGLATAQSPGQTTIFATISNVASLPSTFTTCAVQSISVHLNGAPDKAFTIGTGATQQLQADAIDTNGNPVNTSITWFSSQPLVASVNTTGLVTAAAAGTTSVVAVCSVTCNVGLPSVFGNVVVGTVSGTSAATTVYATGKATTSLVPIDTGANTAGTAITLPANPNSFVMNRTGTKGYLGSSGGLIVLDTAANTVSNNAGLPGTVLAVSPDGNRVLVADTNVINVFNTATSTLSETISIAGATAAAFTPDSAVAYIVAGQTLFFYRPASRLFSVALPSTATSVASLASGAFGYASSNASANIFAAAVCNNTLVDNVATPGTPSFVGALPDGSGVLAVDSPGIDVITATSTLAGCPPPLADTRTSVDFGQGAFTPQQLIILPNGSRAFVTSNLPKLLVYNTAGGTTSTIALANSATAFTGGSTLDGNTLYVGASDNTVHRIDVNAGADAQQISVTFTPDLVAIKPK